ncbi:MAG TPA: alanine racemase [Actinobacteria bacterium]|nr:alanine racemase [Actinomycetota bacterium]
MTTEQAPLPRPLPPEAALPMDIHDERLDTPAILVDLGAVEANVARMAAFAQRAGLLLRPHVKTHKSLAMARRQLAAGAAGLCVATASEAAVMAGTGVNDIVLAYPLVGRRKLERVAALIVGSVLTLVTDSSEVTEGYRGLARQLGHVVPVLVEVDSGMNRAGADPRSVVKVASDVARGDGLKFRGILTHAGHAHDTTDPLSIERVARREARIMGAVREELEAAGLEVPVVSAGSTLTAPYLRASDGITEIRPGTYIYNDLRTLGCYACTHDAIAATALATVVSLNGDRVTIDAGGKTLTPSIDAIYGLGHLRGDPDAPVARLSEEHGVLTVDGAESRVAIGDRVQVLPVHVCAWMDLHAEVYGVRGGHIVERISVDAMRHSL